MRASKKSGINYPDRPEEEGRYIVNSLSFSVHMTILQTDLSTFHKDLHVDKRI